MDSTKTLPSASDIEAVENGLDCAGARYKAQMEECSDFFHQPELSHLLDSRLENSLQSLAATGRYEQTFEELEIGARLAWRNHARCVGRKHWRMLKLLDARHATTADEIAEACWRHLRIATNGGALRSVITVGPLPLPDGREYKIISPQLIRYAGYRNSDGTVTGDPAHVSITEYVTRMGWRGAGTPFDVLPLVISTPHEPVRWYDVPTELVLEVEISHPDYPWFVDLGLKWHAVPAVSNMTLSVGGLNYPLAPFSGWYVSTEVGARNFSDENRYNMLPVIAKYLNLDTRSERTLWRDRALVELNRAVIHSYRRAGVIMVDHHTVAKQFISHVEHEESRGRKCPTDWSWINPPMSAALTPTFHRYFDSADMDIRPNFVSRRKSRGSGCPVTGQ